MVVTRSGGAGMNEICEGGEPFSSVCVIKRVSTPHLGDTFFAMVYIAFDKGTA